MHARVLAVTGVMSFLQVPFKASCTYRCASRMRCLCVGIPMLAQEAIAVAKEYSHVLPPGKMAALIDAFIGALLEDGCVEEVSMID